MVIRNAMRNENECEVYKYIENSVQICHIIIETDRIGHKKLTGTQIPGQQTKQQQQQKYQRNKCTDDDKKKQKKNSKKKERRYPYYYDYRLTFLHTQQEYHLQDSSYKYIPTYSDILKKRGIKKSAIIYTCMDKRYK